MAEQNMNIYQKLAKVRKQVEVIQRNKSGYGYKYVSEDEILAKVSGLMDKYNLSLIPSVVHRVYIVTSSFYETLAVKMTDVLFRYFHFLKWEDVIITSHKQLIHGDVLVDDGVHNLEGGDYLKILMDAPHNRSYDAEQGGMHRVTGWDEAYDIITQYAFQSEHDGEEVEHED